ncbi:MAG: PIN domain-containing protein [Gammaproteobacteria bacterium]
MALRRKGHDSPSPWVAVLADLVHDGRALIMGPVRQELLSGVRAADQFDALREHLRAFPDVELGAGDYEEAASFSNRCRAAGVRGSSVDFLICAVAARRGLSILTTDEDFEHYASILPLTLHPENRDRRAQ